MSNVQRIKVLVLVTGFLLNGLSFAQTDASSLKPTQSGWAWSRLGRIPVQSGGRLKPLDEFARENILRFTGSRSVSGFDPVEWVASVLTKPDAWAREPLIRVGHEDVRKQFVLDPARKLFSVHELMTNPAFAQYANSVASGDSSKQVDNTGVTAVSNKKDPRVDELKRVVDRVLSFQAFVQGQTLLLSPPKSGNIADPWRSLASGISDPTPQSEKFYRSLRAYMDGDQAGFTDNVNSLVTLGAQDPGARVLQAEVLLNRVRPFFQALALYLLAALFWLVSGRFPWARLMAKSLTIMGFALHVFGFALRSYVAGRPPVTNMYESVIWVSFGTMVFAWILYAKFGHSVIMGAATFCAGLVLFAADASPTLMDPSIHPLMPVLRSNFWLTIHVLTITLSYAAFMLAMGISNVTLFHLWRKALGVEGGADHQKRSLLLNDFTYRALQFGTVLLAAGTLLGGIWADYSWGRFWGWDPKEVWALIALLAYIAVLHGRFTGWITMFTFPFWTILSFSTVVMAWYGVNFVLGAGLHSYGFSSGGQGAVATYLVAQTAYCLWIAREVGQAKKTNAGPRT